MSNDEFFEEYDNTLVDTMVDDVLSDTSQNASLRSGLDAFSFASGAALASTIIEDEKEAENLTRQVSEEEKDEDGDQIELIPLSERFNTKTVNKRSRPILRWFSELFSGKKKIDDPISYTPEEMMQILDEEGRTER